MKARLLSLLLVLTLLPLSLPAFADEQKCGPDLTWKLSKKGVLTISGKGSMDDWSYGGQHSPWYGSRDKIVKVVIEEGVTTIGYHAFTECRKLKSVSFPSTLESIHTESFSMAPITELVLPSSLEEIGSIAFQSNAITKLVIPEGVKRIESHAFNNCKKLKSVVIPSTVTDMPVNPFSGCDELKTVTVAPDNECYYAENSCLIDRRDGRLVFAPYGRDDPKFPAGIAVFGASSMRFSNSLTRVTVPNGVRILDDEAFMGSPKLTKVTLPEGLEEIRDEVFSWCRALKTLDIPSTVTVIGEAAFRRTALTEIRIPEGVTRIEKDTFESCASLQRVYLPESVTFIDPSAFRDANASLKIVGAKGSAAQTFAEANGFRFEALKTR